MEQGVYTLAVGVAHFTAGQLDEIGAQCILIFVHLFLFLPHLLGKGIVPLVGQAHGLHHAHTGQLGHVCSGGTGTFHSHGGSVQQALIQQSKALFFGIVRNGEDGQLFQPICKGQQNSGGRQVEDGVDHGNAPGSDCLIDKGKVKQQVCTIENSQEQGDTDDVKVQVHHGGAAGILVGTHRGNQRGDAGADILTHDDGDGTAVGDDTGGAQCLQDTNAGAGALDDAGDNGPHQNAQQRIGEADKQAGEPRLVLQGKHSIGHGGHTGHQHSKADQNGANTLALFAFAHVQKDADKSQHRAEGGGLEHIDQEAVALQAGKTQDPAGDRGAHIAAHDNADGLMQLHDAAVDKADHHNGGGAGALDHGGDAQTQEKALERVVSQFAQDLLQLAAGLLFQRLAHDVHTEQEQGQAAQQGKYIKNSHLKFLALFDTFI